MQDPEVPRELDYRALDWYLSYLYVPAPLSAFKAVRKLPPASTLLYRDGRTRIDRYWQLDYGSKRRVDDPAELHEEIRETIRSAVKRRLVADVPVGAFLSGGIDSSAVVAAMAEASSGPVKTFSIGFEHETFNELPHARRIAKQFDTEHHEFVVRPDAVELLPRIVRHYGEPFADSSAIPSFYLAELTREHVTVALNGDGGDESFAGYYYYLPNLLAGRLDRLPAWMRRAAAAASTRLPSDGNIRSPLSRAHRLSRGLGLDPAARFASYVGCFDQGQREALYTADMRALVGDSDAGEAIAAPWREASGDSVLDVMLEVDMRTYLPGDLLVKMDIATMAHSLEARSPLLDHELMELAASIPPELKLRGTAKKAVLRDALRGWLPDDLLDRPKQGFSVPIADWLRGDLREYAAEVLLDPVALDRGYFNADAVRRTLDRHANGMEDGSARVWALLMLELWHREVLDGHEAQGRATALAA